MILTIYMIDNLLNAMVNPIFMLFNGGLCGMLIRAQLSSSAETLPDHQDQSLPTRFISAPGKRKTRFIAI